MLDYDCTTTDGVSDDWPYGYGICHCGCGAKTRVPTATDRFRGILKGIPIRFIHGHNRGLSRTDFEALALSRVDRSMGQGPAGDCHEFAGVRNDAGYGLARHRGHNYRVHRIAYEAANGPIPDGFHVCHSCDNPPCCNPAHLWLGTDLDNAMDKIRKGRGGYDRRAKRCKTV